MRGMLLNNRLIEILYNYSSRKSLLNEGMGQAIAIALASWKQIQMDAAQAQQNVTVLYLD